MQDASVTISPVVPKGDETPTPLPPSRPRTLSNPRPRRSQPAGWDVLQLESQKPPTEPLPEIPRGEFGLREVQSPIALNPFFANKSGDSTAIVAPSPTAGPSGRPRQHTFPPKQPSMPSTGAIKRALVEAPNLTGQVFRYGDEPLAFGGYSTVWRGTWRPSQSLDESKVCAYSISMNGSVDFHVLGGYQNLAGLASPSR